jgi:ubiquinone/menaquinone biosynthesis C-methylase UbiE
MRKSRVLWMVLGLVGGLLFLWFGVFKLLSKLMGGRGGPCPSSLGWLVDNPLRRRYMRPALGRVGLRPGETALELGPGPGAFTVEAARQLGPGGRLIAADIQPKMIARLEQKVREAGLTNVETHVASAYELPVPDATVDRAFLVTVLAEIPDPVRALHEIRRILKPGGQLSVTEEFPDPDYPRRSTTIGWAEAAGFFLEAYHGNFWVYTLNFRKPAEGQVTRPHAYYMLRKKKLVREFDQVVARVRPLIVARYGEAADAMTAEARQEYAALIPQLPYLGGKRLFTQFLTATAWYLALYRVIQRRGGTVDEAGTLCYQLTQAYMRQMPGFVRRLMSRLSFSERFRQQVRTGAQESHRRRYPGDYVYNYVEGDRVTFDFGVDYLQCAPYEFLKTQGAPELAPYVCTMDVLSSEMFGWGLKRTVTLAEGGERCDFRFRQGGKTEVAVPESIRALLNRQPR